tara:strand:+ start:31 stop:1881 length:1851 start_codon:yes stop_codon:yes gene_type:complete
MPSDETQSTNPIEPRRRRISAESFRTGRNIVSSAQIQQQNLLGTKLADNIATLDRRVAFNERKITILKNILGYQKSDLKQNLAAVTPQAVMLRNLDAILETLRAEAKIEKQEEEFNRKKAENTRRRLEENRVEKRYEKLRKITTTILAPVKSIIDGIIQAFLGLVLGKFLVRLLDFFTDSKNKKKIESLTRFFSDFGPKLLTLYLMFGTKFGRSVGKLSSLIIKGAIRLGAASLMLLKKLGIKGAGGLARGLMGRRGGRLGTLIQLGATAATFFALDKFVSGTLRGNEEEEEEQGYRDGGEVIGKFGIDNIPAMLSDGEFVLVPGAAKELGIPYLERLNKRHGGDNVPESRKGTVYANEGGFIGNMMSAIRSTGMVMAPYGDQYQNEGTKQFQLFGMPVPFTRRKTGYTDEDINRFNRIHPTRMLEKYKTYPSYHTPELEKRYKDKGILDAYYADAVRTVPRTTPLEPLIPGTSSTPKSERERNEEFIRESFKNLPGNLETIGEVNREKQKVLEELGVTPDPNPAQDALRELLKPIFPRMFGPQSSVPSRRQATIAKSSPRVMMPGTPIAQQPRVMVVDGGTNSVDTTEQVSPNPQIPQFSHMGHSMNKLDTLGIG